MKNIILKGITYIAMILFWVSITAMDSENLMIPVITLAVSATWLILFFEINKDSRWVKGE